MRGAFVKTAVGIWCGAVLVALMPAGAIAKSDPPPNIVLITTDDQPLSSFQRQYMPSTFRRLVDRGTSFSDAVVNVPLCCPSRATLLTGQYAHNHGVLTNAPGYPALRDPGNVLPVWLRRAGYRTAHFGKWLHGYETVRRSKPAPGWGRWLTQLNRRRYYGYKLSDDGRTILKGDRPRDHVTPVMSKATSSWVHDQVGGRRPLYVQLDYYAPHVGPRFSDGVSVSRCIGAPEPSSKDRRTILSGSAPRVDSFNEPDISDKPAFFQVPLLDSKQLASLDRRYRCTLESIAGVDRGINRVLRQFQRAGELKNTAFLFLTDNGYFFGEHRIRSGKARPWEEAIRTPLVIRPPKALGPFAPTVDAQAAEIDIPATILDLAGAEPCRAGRCRTLDGRSLLPAMTGDTSDLDGRAVLVEMEDASREPRGFACAFGAVRTSDQILIESTSVPDPQTRRCEADLVYEHYDLARDPFELENLIPPGGAPGTTDQLGLLQRLDRLRSCSGIASRGPATAGGYCE